jgi:hypothetical protein
LRHRDAEVARPKALRGQPAVEMPHLGDRAHGPLGGGSTARVKMHSKPSWARPACHPAGRSTAGGRCIRRVPGKARSGCRRSRRLPAPTMRSWPAAPAFRLAPARSRACSCCTRPGPRYSHRRSDRRSTGHRAKSAAPGRPLPAGAPRRRTRKAPRAADRRLQVGAWNERPANGRRGRVPVRRWRPRPRSRVSPLPWASASAKSPDACRLPPAMRRPATCRRRKAPVAWR